MQAVNTAWGPIPARRVPRRVPRRPPARLALVARLPERAVCSVVCAPVGRPPVVSGKISVCGSRAYERPAMGGLARPLEEEGRTPLRAGDAPCAAAIEEEASVVPLVPDELSPTHCRCCYRYRPRPSAPLEFGKSASTRPLLHAARIARGDMCMHMWAPRGRLIRFKHILCAWRIHSEILSSGSRRWRRDSIALGKPRAVAQKLGAICSERWVLSSYSHSACGEPNNTTSIKDILGQV